MRIRGFPAVVVVSAAFASGCGNANPVKPADVGLTRSEPVVPVPVSGQLTMTGVVTDEEGRPITNATLTRWFGFYEQQSAMTDGSGKYTLQFSASRGSEAGPPGAEDAVAFVRTEAPGYEQNSHYILAPADEIIHDFRLHRVLRITAGESTQVTIRPNDSVCGWDWWPGRETICRWVRISVPTEGSLMVEVVPLDPLSKVAWIEVWNNSGGARSNPAVLTVSAGSDVNVAVAIGWGATSNQSFQVKSSLASR